MGSPQPGRMGRAGRGGQRRPRHPGASRLAEPAAAFSRGGGQRRRRGGEGAGRGTARALAAPGRVADGDRRGGRRHQPVRASRATRPRSLGVARRGAPPRSTRRAPAVAVRGRERGHGGHRRRARRRRRVPRRADPARALADAARPRRQHVGAQGRARRVQAFPTNTPDALYSGAVQAVCGAIELVRARLRRDDADAKCFIAGGTAHAIAPHLAGPVEVVDNLVLEGVLVLAG